MRTNLQVPEGRILGFFLFAIAMAGCGYQPDLPPMAKVSGVVTLDGTPLPRGRVQFVPDAPPEKNAPSSVGEIGPDGKYEMETQGVKGAMVGRHLVRIESTKPPRDETDTMPASLIPLGYNNHATSGIVVEVKAGQDNDIPIQLISMPKKR